MCFNTAYKLILCLMRRLVTQDDRINAPIAGFISGLALGLDANSRRELFMHLAMSRAINASINIGESTDYIPKLFSNHKDVILWFVANCFIQTTMGLNQGVMNSGVRKFYQTWSQMTHNDRVLVKVWHKMLKDGVPGF